MKANIKPNQRELKVCKCEQRSVFLQLQLSRSHDLVGTHAKWDVTLANTMPHTFTYRTYLVRDQHGMIFFIPQTTSPSLVFLLFRGRWGVFLSRNCQRIWENICVDLLQKCFRKILSVRLRRRITLLVWTNPLLLTHDLLALRIDHWCVQKQRREG